MENKKKTEKKEAEDDGTVKSGASKHDN